MASIDSFEFELFFAYPSQPPILREAIRTSAERIGPAAGVRCTRWEDLHVSGTIVIDEILHAIARAQAGIYEVTHLNPNVLFELGFAVGTGKHVFPILNDSVADAKRRWEATRILGPVGYASYHNSEDVVAAVLRERPQLRTESLFDSSIGPALRPAGPPSIFYVTNLYNDDASAALTRVVRSEADDGIRLVVADPSETSVQSLTWYAQQIYDAAVVVVHFESPLKLNADTHNARAAFIGGLAHGMHKPVLMLAVDDYSAPFDYRDLLYPYSTAADCSTRASYWLRRELEDVRRYLGDIAVERKRRELSTELRTIQLGEPVAENEAADLDLYFIETNAYQEIMGDRTAVYVGRRGTGKTATMIQAARQLAEDRRSLVCSITPAGYEIDALARLLRGYREKDTRGYVIEAMWKFLLYSELALAALAEAAMRPAGLQPEAEEWELSQFLHGAGADLDAEFDVRLERAILRLEEANSSGSVEEERASIVEALYRDQLSQLQTLLRQALAGRSRITVLIDNLDKAWDQNSDLETLAYLLLGLLSTVPSIADDLRRSPNSRLRDTPFTVAVFIRTDIYSQLVRTALEPDKLPIRRLEWNEPARLVQLIEERYEASVDREVVGSEIWTRYFCPDVRGLDTRDYILRRILPRPRDILVLVRAAIDAAALRHSDRVEEEDILTAEEAYSQFAFDAIKIEDPDLSRRLENAFVEFAGGPAVFGHDELTTVLQRADLELSEHVRALDQLRDLSFLGVEVRPDEFDFSDDPSAKRRADVLARRLTEKLGHDQRFAIHPAFRPYLEIVGE